MTQTASLPAVLEPRTYHLTAQDFVKMLDFEILDPNRRFEFIEGRIVEMGGVNKPHRHHVNVLSAQLSRALEGRAMVSVQNPLDLQHDRSLPLPDLVIVPESRYQNHHFTAQDASVVVEVSDSTLAYDRSTKLALYAREGVREYWIVNVPDGTLEVYREPQGELYKYRRIHTAGEAASPLEYPDVALEWWA